MAAREKYLNPYTDFGFKKLFGTEANKELLIDTKTHRVFYDKLTFIYLEMPKFEKTEAELANRFDKWLYVLKSLSRFQERPKVLKERIFNKLFHVAELAKFTPVEVRGYEESLKIYRDNYAVMETALNKATAKGMKKGMKEGIKEGMEKGKIEGKIEVAKSLIKMNIPLAQIIEATGLSENEIRQLIKQ